MRLLSYSEVQTAMTCQARWDFSYGGHLAGGHTFKPRELAGILGDGRAWGTAIAAWHAYDATPSLLGDGSDFAHRWHAHLALRAGFAQDVLEQRENGVHVDLGLVGERSARIGGVLDHYISTADPLPGRLEQLEAQMIVPIPSRKGGRVSNKYRFLAYVDGIVMIDGKLWIVEFKLRGRLTAVKVIEKSRQIRWYAWAKQQELGVPIAGVIVEERLNELPKPARLLKGKDLGMGELKERLTDLGVEIPKGARKDDLLALHAAAGGSNDAPPSVSHAKDQLCTVDSYLAACREFDEHPHEDVVEALSARLWQQRVPIPFRPSELEEAGRELVSSAKLIRDLDSAELYPVRNASQQNCGGCKFRDICSDPTNDPYAATIFTFGEPKRLKTGEPTAPSAPPVLELTTA